MSYSGWIFLEGGPREGDYGPVKEHDLSLRLFFDKTPPALYLPSDPSRLRETSHGPIPVYCFAGEG